MRDWILALFNRADIHAIDNVCKNIGYELVIEDGKITDYIIIKEEKLC